MRVLIFTSLLVCCFVATSRHDDCSCRKPGKGETTHSGPNENIVSIDRDTYKSVTGSVHAPNGVEVDGALVEVFDKPEWMLGRRKSSPPKQRRIAACKTGDDGKFCFEDLPAGEYELVASKDGGWNPSHVYIKIRPDDPKAKTSIDLNLNPGW